MRVELVERASLGDRDAFASLAASHVDRCYALAFRILRDLHSVALATRARPRAEPPESWLHDGRSIGSTERIPVADRSAGGRPSDRSLPRRFGPD
jgi:hypothetical protein